MTNKTNDIVNELSKNFIEYAAAVNEDRAIPDATSGLKPVARRILWGAFERGYGNSKPHVKSARIVGDIMGSYHPHGDGSIYGAMIRLSQNWVMRYPLIEVHGSNGNIDGDGPAAMRYTESRLSKLAEEGMLAGIKKRNVDFIPNYSEDSEEPITLPAIFPNLLCNPNTGIGVAMACNFAPHNLKEVGQAIHDYIEGKEPMLPGPDFPTGGIIINMNDMPSIMATGHGSVKIRAKYKIEGRNIVFYEIPYGTCTEDIMTEIGEVSESEDINGIVNIRNESNKKGLRIVVECEKGVSPDAIANKLFLKTKLQTTFSYNQVALVNKTPTELNLKDCIKIYIEHNIQCLKKETKFDLEKAQARLEVIEGLIKALENIDNIIAFIKKSESSAAAKDGLIKEYKFTEPQAKSIITMRLGSLAKLEKIELNEEKSSLTSDIEHYNTILKSEQAQIEVILERLDTLVKKFGDARKTELTQINISKEDNELSTVIPEDVIVVLGKEGSIKKIPRNSFKPQRRGGVGLKTTEEAPLVIMNTNTLDNLLLFTDKGVMYKLLVDKIPSGSNTTKGVNVLSLINSQGDEKIIAATSISKENLPKNVIFVTKNGLVKKTEFSEYTKTKRTTGIQAIKLKEGDNIAAIELMNEEEMLIVTKDGLAIRFETKDINPQGKNTLGVKGITLLGEDEVITAFKIEKNDKKIAVFTSIGTGKIVSLDKLPIQGRGGRGNLLKVRKDEYSIIGAFITNQTEEALVIGENTICINLKDLTEHETTYTQGVKVIQGNIIKSVSKI